jgi:UDP-N-acetyl-2-amino-2-deoxyglucuronate dehydrogenase
MSDSIKEKGEATMRFAIIGCAGYIAPRHLQAIKDIGGELIAACDKSDSVGILDRYFKNVSFFTEFERFDRYCEKIRREGIGIDYVSICTPNFLHDAHCRFALRIGANAICEKPVVIKTKNILQLSELENEYKKKIYTISQLRYHPKILAIKEEINKNPEQNYMVNLNYVTPRGKWYHYSWKGNKEKSGGLLMNIGFHFIDVLGWLFGKLGTICVLHNTNELFECAFSTGRSEIKCRLSIDENEKALREFIINGEQIDFTEGFDKLHTKCYQEIMNGNGYGIGDSQEAISVIEWIK